MQEYSYRKNIKIRKEKLLDDYPSMLNAINYKVKKILESNSRLLFRGVQLYEQDGDNFIKNLVTVSLEFRVKREEQAA